MQDWHEGRASDAEVLCGNPTSYIIEHWTHVLEHYAREDGDYTYDNVSVKVARVEEKIFAQLFKTTGSRKN